MLRSASVATSGTHTRRMTDADLPRATELCIELGYPVTEDEVRARFARLEGDPVSGLFVAERAGATTPDVVGFAQAALRIVLASPPHVELLALSVAARAQRTGAGRALVDATIAFARERGVDRVRVRSNIAREGSHRFYRALGFALRKTQHAYELAL